MEDFAAVCRLCEGGEAFFREAYADYPVKLARALRENRALKEKAGRLSEVQSELDKVNAALAEKNKLLENMLSMKTELARATSSEKTLKSQNAELQASVETLRAKVAVAEGRVESARADGFTQAYRVSYVLALFIDSAYYDVLHTAKDDKIWKDGQVVISGDDYREKIAKEAMMEVDDADEEDQPKEETNAGENQ